MSNKTYEKGFQLIDQLESSGLRYYPVGSAVAIEDGDAIVMTSGYAALATADVGLTFAGIAFSTNTAAEASADGVVDVAIIPPLLQYRFIAPCEATGKIALTDVGSHFDIQTEDGIDEGDTSVTSWGFYCDAIDISTEAIEAAAYGFCIGHWVFTT